MDIMMNFILKFQKWQKYKYNVNIDAYFVSQFCPLSNSIWSEKLSYVYLSRMELPKTEYKVYTTSDLNNDILFKQAEKKLLLYGKYEQY